VGQHVVLSRVGVTPFPQVAMVSNGNTHVHRGTVGLQDKQPFCCKVGVAVADVHSARRVRSQLVAEVLGTGAATGQGSKHEGQQFCA